MADEKLVKFYRGLRNKYSSTTHLDGIYFATDTLEIILNNEVYSGLLKSDKPVKNITVSDGVMTITYTDGSQSTVEVGSGKYQSNIADKTLTMPNDVGGIAKDTVLTDLEGKTYDAILDDLLFPTINPTFTAPSASISLKQGQSSTREVGSTAPSSDNFTVSYNAGLINLNGIKQANRGGTQDVNNSFIYYGSSASNTTLPTTVSEGSTSYKYRAAYAQGPQPKDNKGNNYSSPLAAGTVDSTAVTVNGTWPWYATTVTAGTLTKQSLIAWNATAGSMTAGGTAGFDLQPHTTNVPQQFKLPRKISSMQMYNTVAKAFENAAVSDWTETSSTETINGLTRTYYTYSYKGANRGSVKLIVKF